MASETNSSEQLSDGWMQSSTVRAVQEAGLAAGREYGTAEATSSTYARLLQAQAKQKFGSADVSGRKMLDALAEGFACTQLEQLADGLITASSWNSWLEGVVVPPPAPGPPSYTQNLDFDFEKSGPSIDTHMKVAMFGGRESVVHLRFQKWYQPDLDRHLFEESCKIERQTGMMPLVLVFLMWPPAEGPGMTGRFEERDNKGKVKRVFTYKLQRAWQLEPEAMTNAIGTMLLAPLTKDSRRRMPEIVQMMKKGLDKCGADDDSRAAVWDACYWSMGLICDLDEAHRALGDMLPIIQKSRHYLSAMGHAFTTAYSVAQREEGPPAAARALVLRQGARRFGPSPEAEAALNAISSLEELDNRALRVLTANSWAELLGTRLVEVRP